MESTEYLSAGLAANTQVLLEWTDRLAPHQFELRPAPEKWNVLEVLEHLFVVEKGAARLSKVDGDAVHRDLTESRTRMANGMANLDQRFAGGSNIDPKGRFSSYAEWRAAFIANREDLVQLGNEKGWAGLCAAFPHPYFGHLTRAEWLIFVGLHVDRHLAQMQRYVNG